MVVHQACRAAFGDDFDVIFGACGNAGVSMAGRSNASFSRRERVKSLRSVMAGTGWPPRNDNGVVEKAPR